MSDNARERRRLEWLIWRACLIGLAVVYAVLASVKLLLVVPVGYSWTAIAIVPAVAVLALPVLASLLSRRPHGAWLWGWLIAYACLLQLCAYVISH
jgi:hypothetical protein